MKTILLTSALAIAASGASAASLSFDLTAGGYATNQSVLEYSVGGVDLDVTGIRCGTNRGPNSNTCRDERIDRYASGIGMYRGGLDSHQVDGLGKNEFLELSFSADITLESVSFSYYSSNDDFEFYTLSGSTWAYEGQFDACTSWCFINNYTHSYDFADDYTGKSFLLGAFDSNDDWKLAGVTIDYTDNGGNIPPVPLPAAGWMLLAGLGGLAAMKRRKNAA